MISSPLDIAHSKGLSDIDCLSEIFQADDRSHHPWKFSGTLYASSLAVIQHLLHEMVEYIRMWLHHYDRTTRTDGSVQGNRGGDCNTTNSRSMTDVEGRGRNIVQAPTSWLTCTGCMQRVRTPTRFHTYGHHRRHLLRFLCQQSSDGGEVLVTQFSKQFVCRRAQTNALRFFC